MLYPFVLEEFVAWIQTRKLMFHRFRKRYIRAILRIALLVLWPEPVKHESKSF